MQFNKLLMNKALCLLGEVFILHDVGGFSVHIWNAKLIEGFHNARVAQKPPRV
jgi:hypothetical protein